MKIKIRYRTHLDAAAHWACLFLKPILRIRYSDIAHHSWAWGFILFQVSSSFTTEYLINRSQIRVLGLLPDV